MKLSHHNVWFLTSQETIVVEGNDVGHKWSGCILSAEANGRSTSDITYHLQAASRAFRANKQILCDKKVRLAIRLRFFDRVITPVALFASGHRTIRMSDLCKLDVVYRKMLRYDRRAATFRRMERTLAWYSASLEWTFSGTRTATWIEHLVWAMPQTSLENLRCMLRICPRTGGSSECCFGIRLVHELGGTHAMIGLGRLWHRCDFNSGASGITLPRIRRCGCSWAMIL